MSGILTLDLFLSIFRLALPMAFAVLGGLVSERSGTAQIGLEGMMLAGALAAASVTPFVGSPWIGMLVAIFVGVLLATIMGIFVIWFNAEHIIVGTALNLLVYGLAPFFTKVVFNSTGATPALAQELRMTWEPYILFAIVFLGFLYVYQRTQWGLWLRFAGENPKVLLSSGISVQRVQWSALWFCGGISAVGGSVLTLMLSSSYAPMMTAGRGFMALAAIIFGAWRPVPALLACLFFALTDAIQIRLQGSSEIPVQFIQILPYVVTIVALAGLYGKHRPPQNLGRTS